MYRTYYKGLIDPDSANQYLQGFGEHGQEEMEQKKKPQELSHASLFSLPDQSRALAQTAFQALCFYGALDVDYVSDQGNANSRDCLDAIGAGTKAAAMPVQITPPIQPISPMQTSGATGNGSIGST